MGFGRFSLVVVRVVVVVGFSWPFAFSFAVPDVATMATVRPYPIPLRNGNGQRAKIIGNEERTKASMSAVPMSESILAIEEPMRKYGIHEFPNIINMDITGSGTSGNVSQRRNIMIMIALTFALLSHLLMPYSGFDLSPFSRPRAMFAETIRFLVTFPKKHSMAFGVAVTTFKTITADALIQFTTKKPNSWAEFDFRRTAAFAVYGLLYLGLFQHYAYTHLYTELFPRASKFAASTMAQKLVDPRGMIAVFGQVAADIGFCFSLLGLPFYYACRTLATNSAGLKDMFHSFANSVRKELWGDVKVSWLWWVPASTFNFGLLPLHWQVPFTALVSFGFTASLSLRQATRRKQDQH